VTSSREFAGINTDMSEYKSYPADPSVARLGNIAVSVSLAACIFVGLDKYTNPFSIF
jgi:hypothetical protein